MDREKFLEIFNTIDFEKIKDHPNILIAANFWEEDRFLAAKICYRFMRAIDDLIDNHRATNWKIKSEEQEMFKANVNKWLQMIINPSGDDPLQKKLLETISIFRIPLWPLEAFAKSMIYDINNDGFPTLEKFLEYAQGASVAPASIFVHLNSLTKTGDHYEPPSFDVESVSTPCAIFSYIVHIIRDFQKDQLNHLNYFADDLLLKHGLTRQKLRDFAEGEPVNRNFRSLIGEYYRLAKAYKTRTYDMICRISPLLESRYRLSLQIIFELYLMVFEKIDLDKGQFTTEEMNPDPQETRKRVLKTILKFER